MKRVYIFLLVIILLLAGCSKQNNINGKSVDNISVFYGLSSYAMFGAEQTIIDDLYERFSSLAFEKTSQEIDVMTAFTVCFYEDDHRIKSFHVDSNGIFWLDGGTQCYKIKSGEFDYGYLKEIYTASRQ